MAAPILNWILEGLPQAVQVKPFDDLSFIYEAQLAKMELTSWWDSPDEFRKRAAYFEEVNGKKTLHYYISDIKGKGQIGRTNQYLTHWYYPYKAKFHPQMIKAIINWMGLRSGQTLLDPFAGSGTALIEAKLAGVDSVGVDIDPFCTFLSQVKTDLLDLAPEELQSVDPRPVFDYFESSKQKSPGQGLTHLLEPDNSNSPLHKIDEIIRRFLLLTYLYALSDHTYVKKDMRKAFDLHFSEMSKSLREFHSIRKRFGLAMGRVSTKTGDSKFLSEQGIQEQSIDGIVTSPPYSIAVDYISNDLHTLRYLGIEPVGLGDKLIGLRGKHEERVRIYFEDMKQAFLSMYEVLRPRGKCAIVVGDVTFEGNKLPITQTFIEDTRTIGFKLVDLIRRPILGGFARLRYENVIMLQKS